ncbi:MAG: DUF4349 domain-containing protein [Lachnospirales bacterium]
MEEIKETISCEEFELMLVDNYEGLLTEEEKVAFKAHKKQCKKCKKSFKLFKEMMETLKNDSVDLPEGFHSRLMDKIGSECFFNDKVENEDSIIINDIEVIKTDLSEDIEKIEDTEAIEKMDTDLDENVIGEQNQEIENVDQVKEDLDNKEKISAFVTSFKDKAKGTVDFVVTSTEGVKEKVSEKVSEVVHNKDNENAEVQKVIKEEHTEEVAIVEAASIDTEEKVKTSFTDKITDFFGMKKKTLGFVVAACCCIIAVPIIASVMDFGVGSTGTDYAVESTGAETSNLMELAEDSESDLSDEVVAGGTTPQVSSAKASVDRAVFEKYVVDDSFKTGNFNLVYENNQKFANTLFAKINADENMRVLNEQLSKRESNSVGTTTYKQGDFFDIYGDDLESYNFNHNDIPYVVEEYNAHMISITNQINLLDDAKDNLSNKEASKLETEILLLESQRDAYMAEFQRIESSLGNYAYSITVSNYDNVWRDGFFTTIINDLTNSINFSFVLVLILFAITVILLILQKVFNQKIDEIDLKKHYSKFLKGALAITFLSTLIFVISSVFETYDSGYSTGVGILNDFLYTKDVTESATSEVDEVSNSAYSEYEEQVAYSGYVSLEIKNLQKASNSVDEIIDTYDVKVEDSSYSNGDFDYMYMTLRVPNDSYDEVYNKLLTLGTVVESNKSMENYTDTLTTLEFETSNLKNTIETYKDSVSDFTKADDIINIASTISSLEYDQYYNDTMALALQDKVDYSTINLTLAKTNSGIVFLQPSFYGDIIGTVFRIFAYILSFALLIFLPIIVIYLFNRIAIKVFKIVRFKKITSGDESKNPFVKIKNKVSKSNVIEETVVNSDTENLNNEIENNKESEVIENTDITVANTDTDDNLEVLNFSDKYAKDDEK